jgi:hypothetical protein
MICGIENFMTGIYNFTTGGTSTAKESHTNSLSISGYVPATIQNRSPSARLRVRPIAHSVHDLRETSRTVRAGEKAVGRIHAMCLSVQALSDPAFRIERRACFVSKESTNTTDGK